MNVNMMRNPEPCLIVCQLNYSVDIFSTLAVFTNISGIVKDIERYKVVFKELIS